MNILVVDNSKMAREIIREEVESLGYNVIEASTSQEVYEKLSAHKMDLITLAVELRDESGYDICKKIRSNQIDGDKLHNRVPILFITGNDTMEGREKGYEAGATEFITKPFAKGFIAENIKRLLQPEITPLKGLTAIVIDDSMTARSIVTDFLKSRGVHVVEAKDGLEGYNLIQENLNSVDIVITDMMMPHLRGDELCHRVRNELKYPDLPIIVLSGAKEQISILEIFQSGATDYLHKPFIQEELLARISVHLQSRILKRKLKTKIKQLKDSNEKLETMACTDSLTQLHNRKYLFERFLEYNEKKERYGRSYAFMIVDIDYFKKINDTYGHQMGDGVIKELGLVINNTIRKSDILARIGGEEFSVIVTDLEEPECRLLAEKIRSAIEKHVFCENIDTEFKKLTVSMGMYISHQFDNLTIEEIYNRADECLYKAKEAGRNQVVTESSPSTDF